MEERLLKHLAEITPEEQILLSQNCQIDRSIYMQEDSAQVDCNLLLEKGKLITLRPHTRFAGFPRHTHNFVEMVYMCQGQTRHIINGNEVCLKKGEILLLGQSAIQEIEPAGKDDIAVNFIILPQFFDETLRLMGEEDNPLRDFLINCLCGREDGISYLHFEAADILPIQNLVENLIWTLMNHQANKRSINQLTMGLLFLQLANHTETLHVDPDYKNRTLLFEVLRYTQEHYRDGSLQELSEELHYDPCWLSRQIKQKTGRNFTDLIQDKRLSQAAYLLKTTGLKISEISQSVGYENFSYFHRLFRKRYQVSPFQFRKKEGSS